MQLKMNEARKSLFINQTNFTNELQYEDFSIEIPELSTTQRNKLIMAIVDKDGKYNVSEMNKKYFTEHGIVTGYDVLGDDNEIIADKETQNAFIYDWGDKNIIAKIDEVIRDSMKSQEDEKKTEVTDSETTPTGL